MSLLFTSLSIKMFHNFDQTFCFNEVSQSVGQYWKSTPKRAIKLEKANNLLQICMTFEDWNPYCGVWSGVTCTSQPLPIPPQASHRHREATFPPGKGFIIININISININILVERLYILEGNCTLWWEDCTICVEIKN